MTKPASFGEKEPVDANITPESLSDAGHAAANPDLYIDPEAERRLVRKLDLRILPVTFLCYFLMFLDRSNIGNARVAGLEKDLKLGTYDFNLGASLFYVTYMLAEVPFAALIKRTSFLVIPIMVIMFGIVTLCTAWLHNRAGFFAVRSILGVAEAATMPGLSYFISRYYRRHELTGRIGWYMLSAAGMSQAFGGLISSGLLARGQIGSVKSWRTIFLVEGIITVGLGIMLLFLFPSDPSKTRMLTEEERALAIRRSMVDQPAALEDKEKMTWKLVLKTLNINTLTCSFIYVCNNITVQGLGVFTPTILRLNYPGSTTVRIQLLSVPPAIVGMIVALTTSYVVMKTKRHGLGVLFGATLSIIGYGIWTGTKASAVKLRYAAIFFNTAAGFTYGPVVVGWSLANASPDTVRALTGAFVTGLGNIGSITATWSYLPTDAKNGYRIGNVLNLSCGSAVIVITSLLVLYQVRENKLRAAGGRDYRLERGGIDKLGLHHPSFKYIH